MLHGWDGFLWLASLTPFSSKHSDGHYGQTVLSTCVIANHCLAFLWRFWSRGFFLAEQPFSLCRYRFRFTADIDTFVPVSSSIFTRSFAVVLGLIWTFYTKIHPSLGDRTCLLPEWWLHGGYTCVLLFV
jgi:hypothetical protein